MQGQVLLFLIYFGSSLVGFGLVLAACFLTRSWKWLIGALIAGILFHLVSAFIIGMPNFGVGEPSGDQFEKAHDLATFYFFDGLPFFVAPLLIKFLIVYIRSHNKPV